jgi:hypothetical protein
MLKLITLSDAQSELMQGGGRRRSKKITNNHCAPKPRPCHPGMPGPSSHSSSWIGVMQTSNNLALSLGGHGGSVYNEVEQNVDIEL